MMKIERKKIWKGGRERKEGETETKKRGKGGREGGREGMKKGRDRDRD